MATIRTGLTVYRSPYTDITHLSLPPVVHEAAQALDYHRVGDSYAHDGALRAVLVLRARTPKPRGIAALHNEFRASGSRWSRMAAGERGPGGSVGGMGARRQCPPFTVRCCAPPCRRQGLGGAAHTNDAVVTEALLGLGVAAIQLPSAPDRGLGRVLVGGLRSGLKGLALEGWGAGDVLTWGLGL